MRTNKKTNNQKIQRRPILIICVILLIAVAGLIIAKILTDQAAENSESDAQETTVDTSDDTTDETVSETDALGESDSDDGKNIKQYEGEDPNNYESLTGVITYADVSDGTLIIRTNIDQSLSSGTCNLKLTNGTREYSESALIVLTVSTATCEGFDIPTSELSSGAWNIEISLDSNNKSGTITGSVNI